jgi:hypothetical protein
MTKEEIYTKLLRRTLNEYLVEIRDAESKIQSIFREVLNDLKHLEEKDFKSPEGNPIVFH